MKHVLGMVGRLFGLIVTMIFVAMIVGGRLQPDWAPYLDHIEKCGQTLCVFGIAPDITPLRQVRPILDKNTADRQSLQIGTSFDGWKHPEATAHSYSGPIDGLNILDLSNKLTVGGFIGLFGPPCAISDQSVPGQSIYSYTLRFPSMIVTTYTTDRTLAFNPHTAIRWIDADSSLTCALTDGNVTWAGFRSHYRP